MSTVKLIWKSQQLFRESAQSGIERLLDALGCDLDPALYLLGFSMAEGADQSHICVEPVDCPFQSDTFGDIVAPENQPYGTSLEDQVIDAIQRRVRDNQTKIYCSRFSQVKNYAVGVVFADQPSKIRSLAAFEGTSCSSILSNLPKPD